MGKPAAETCVCGMHASSGSRDAVLVALPFTMLHTPEYAALLHRSRNDWSNFALRIMYAVLAAAVVLMCIVSYHQQAPQANAMPAKASSRAAAVKLHSVAACAGLDSGAECQNDTAAMVQDL